MKHPLVVILAFTIFFGLSACTDSVTNVDPAGNQEMSASGARGDLSIAELVVLEATQNNQFKTLLAALQSADLVSVFTGKQPYTVFAPTDAAFASLGLNETNIGTLDKATLTNILLYHVTRGTRQSQSVVSADKILMLNGDFAPVSGATIAGANIVAVDIKASNGIIHVIDAVLIPPAN